MCFSARIQQDLYTLARRFGAAIDWGMFEALFRLRVEDSDVKIARALEANFATPKNPESVLARQHIDRFRSAQATAWEQDLFKQKKRLADAQRSLKDKETKKARNDERVATHKIETYVQRLTDLKRTESRPNDSRIFPKYYAPVIVSDAGKLVIRPMRYLCRLEGKPANYDERFPGTYNARRDSLNQYWSGTYGTHHGIIVVDSFFENVPLHLYEKRELGAGEKEQNIVLHFNPRTAEPMIVACLWSHWTGKDEPDLYSFAAVTDEPPPEIAETGHQRCIISLKEQNVAEWLSPATVLPDRLNAILSDTAAPLYEHRIAA